MFVFAMVVTKRCILIFQLFLGALMIDGLSEPSKLLEKRGTVKIPVCSQSKMPFKEPLDILVFAVWRHVNITSNKTYHSNSTRYLSAGAAWAVSTSRKGG